MNLKLKSKLVKILPFVKVSLKGQAKQIKGNNFGKFISSNMYLYLCITNGKVHVFMYYKYCLIELIVQ